MGQFCIASRRLLQGFKCNWNACNALLCDQITFRLGKLVSQSQIATKSMSQLNILEMFFCANRFEKTNFPSSQAFSLRGNHQHEVLQV